MVCWIVIHDSTNLVSLLFLFWRACAIAPAGLGARRVWQAFVPTPAEKKIKKMLWGTQISNERLRYIMSKMFREEPLNTVYLKPLENTVLLERSSLPGICLRKRGSLKVLNDPEWPFRTIWYHSVITFRDPLFLASRYIKFGWLVLRSINR